MLIRTVQRSSFIRAYTTHQHIRYWKNNKSEQYWKNYQGTWSHKHRQFISSMLHTITWTSLLEVGCGSAPNFINFVKTHQNKQYAGVDVSPVALKVAANVFEGIQFKVGTGDSIFMSDKSTDVVLCDAMLMYIGPREIRKYLREFIRVTRTYIVLYEYHNESWWVRTKLRIFSGRHAYDYKKLLESEDFYDVQVFRMPPFEHDNEQKFRYLILAKVPD